MELKDRKVWAKEAIGASSANVVVAFGTAAESLKALLPDCHFVGMDGCPYDNVEERFNIDHDRPRITCGRKVNRIGVALGVLEYAADVTDLLTYIAKNVGDFVVSCRLVESRDTQLKAKLTAKGYKQFFVDEASVKKMLQTHFRHVKLLGHSDYNQRVFLCS